VDYVRKQPGDGFVIERVAGKDYTTLEAITKMRELCRQNPKGPTSGSGKPDATSEAGPPTKPSGSSSTDRIKRAQSVAGMIVRELKEHSPNTSIASTSRRQKKGVRDPAEIPVADVLALYGADIARGHARPKETAQ